MTAMLARRAPFNEAGSACSLRAAELPIFCRYGLRLCEAHCALLHLATSQQSATSVATSVPPRLRESERGESEVGSAIQTTGEGSRSLRELPNDEDEDEDEDDDLRRSKVGLRTNHKSGEADVDS
eukprot:2464097-Prymnesium_polylepis.2